MSHPHVQIIIGSVRDGRASGPVARWVADRFETEFERPAEIVDLRDWRLPDFYLSDPPAMGHYPAPLQNAWATTIARADAFVFIVPEYNHGYTAALKNALDWVYAEWSGKPVAFVSFGNANGTRAIQQIKQVLGEVRAVPIEQTLGLKPHGNIESRQFNGTEEDAKRLSRTLSELLRWQSALKPLCAPLPDKSWRGKKVQVIGLDSKTNRRVITPLIASGIDARGLVLEEGDPLPDCADFDLLAIGRGAAGKTADAIRDKLRKTDPAKPVLDVLGPIAVRQILSALNADGPRLEVSAFKLVDNRVSLRISGDDGRIGVTVYEKTEVGLMSRRIADVWLEGEVDIAVTLPGAPYSLIVDLDGVAFWHRAVEA